MNVRKNSAYERSAAWILQKAYYSSNKKRSIVLIITSSMMTACIILIFGFLAGKIKIDELRYHRENGSSVYAYVENGTEKTGNALKNHTGISYAGAEKIYGFLMSNGMIYSDCSFMDADDWKKLKAVAYTDIQGTYPQKANEIMMPLRTLEALGIERPKIGMKLCLEFYWKSVFVQKGTGRQEFVLSGYYRDYSHQNSGSSMSYFSNEKLAQAGISKFPCRILLQVDSGLQSGKRVEKLLTESLALEKDEYVVAEDSAFYKSVEGIAGGFGAGVILCVLNFFSVFLLVWQMARSSFVKEARLFQTMHTLGVTRRQIRRAVCRQYFQEFFAGILLGEAAAWLIVQYVFPGLLKEMYLQGMGEARGDAFLPAAFYLWSTLILSAAGILTIWKCFQNVYKNEVQGKKRKGGTPAYLREKRQKKLWKKRRSFLLEMAWHFTRISGGSLCFSIFLTALGGVVVLCAAGLTKGTDFIKKLETQPEYQIGITYNSYNFFCRQESELAGFDFFPEKLESQLKEIAKRLGGDAKIRKGYLLGEFDSGSYTENQDGVISGLYRYAPDQPQGIVCPLSGKEEKQFLKRISSEREELKEGEAVLLHQGIPFDHEQEENWEETEFQIMDTVEGGSTAAEMACHTAQLKIVECVDLFKNELTDFDFFWNSENVCWMVVSEDTFRDLSEKLNQQILRVDFYISEKEEEQAGEEIRKEIEKINREFRTEYGVTGERMALASKAEKIAQQKNYLRSSRICMSAVCLLLLLWGVMTYVSTRSLQLVLCEKEMRTLRILGMTGRFQKKALKVEGMFHCTVIVLLMAIMGRCAVHFLNEAVRMQSEYFSVEFPYRIFVVLSAVIYAGAMLLELGKEK